MSDLPGSPNCDSLERRCAAAETLLATLNREHLEEIGAVQAMGLVLHFCSARNGRGPLPLYGGLALHLLSHQQPTCGFGSDVVDLLPSAATLPIGLEFAEWQSRAHQGGCTDKPP